MGISMNRVVAKMPLYLVLAGPAAVGCIWVLGTEWGVVVGVVANLALWHILLRPPTETDDSN